MHINSDTNILIITTDSWKPGIDNIAKVGDDQGYPHGPPLHRCTCKDVLYLWLGKRYLRYMSSRADAASALGYKVGSPPPDLPHFILSTRYPSFINCLLFHIYYQHIHYLAIHSFSIHLSIIFLLSVHLPSFPHYPSIYPSPINYHSPTIIPSLSIHSSYLQCLPIYPAIYPSILSPSIYPSPIHYHRPITFLHYPHIYHPPLPIICPILHFHSFIIHPSIHHPSIIYLPTYRAIIRSLSIHPPIIIHLSITYPLTIIHLSFIHYPPSIIS